jgi:hypothetical protein
LHYADFIDFLTRQDGGTGFAADSGRFVMIFQYLIPIRSARRPGAGGTIMKALGGRGFGGLSIENRQSRFEPNIAADR